NERLRQPDGHRKPPTFLNIVTSILLVLVVSCIMKTAIMPPIIGLLEVQRQPMRKKRSKMPFVYAAVVIVLFGALFALKSMNRSDLYDKPVSELNPATRELLKDPNYQNIILPGKLEERIGSGEPTFIYFFASTCSFCRETTPIL